jgi:hypothetical protein
MRSSQLTLRYHTSLRRRGRVRCGIALSASRYRDSETSSSAHFGLSPHGAEDIPACGVLVLEDQWGRIIKYEQQQTRPTKLQDEIQACLPAAQTAPPRPLRASSRYPLRLVYSLTYIIFESHKPRYLVYGYPHLWHNLLRSPTFYPQSALPLAVTAFAARPPPAISSS